MNHLADQKQYTEILALFLIIAVALALTPTIQVTAVQAQYSAYTQSNVVVVSTSNSTTLTYSAQNASTNALNDLWWTVTLNQTNFKGYTTIYFNSPTAGNLSYSADKTLTFNPQCLNATKTYLVTITYNYLSASAAVQGLVMLTPLLWVILIIASTVVIVYKKLKLG